MLKLYPFITFFALVCFCTGAGASVQSEYNPATQELTLTNVVIVTEPSIEPRLQEHYKAKLKLENFKVLEVEPLHCNFSPVREECHD